MGKLMPSPQGALATCWYILNPGAPLPRLPRDFLWACRRLHVALTRYVLVVEVYRQEVRVFELLRRPRDERHEHEHAGTPVLRDAPVPTHPPHGYRISLRARYRASTSRFGIGQLSGSNCTPLGLHRVAEKIGAGQPIGTAFKSRRPVGLTWQGMAHAPIAHRILWLEGLEPGFNRGVKVDSHARYIYIHGLGDEPSLGRPASHGCIHLSAADLMPLFDFLPVGTLVWICLLP